MNDLNAIIRDSYRRAVAASSNEGTTIRDAAHAVTEELSQLVRDGSLTISPEEYLPLLVRRADERDGALADRVLTAYAMGQPDLGDDVSLDVVVTLGGGQRKTWRNVTSDDLIAMDDLRYRNMRSAVSSYEEWRRVFTLARRAMRTHPTMGDAVAAGAFDALLRVVA